MIDFINIYGATKVQFKKGEVIARQSEPVDYIFYLEKGAIQAISVSDGGDVVISDERKGQAGIDSAINLVCAFNGEAACTANFVAKTDCICYRIPKEEIMAALRQDAETLYSLVENASKKYNRTLNLLLQGQTKDAVCRLCEFLMEHAEPQGNALCVPKQYTNAEISRFLGIHHVTASRIIKALKDQEIIRRCSKGLELLNQVALQRYIDGEERLIYS